MGKKRMPELPDTGRRYMENTLHARLASPGIERFQRPRERTRSRLWLAVLGLAALVGAMLWLGR